MSGSFRHVGCYLPGHSVYGIGLHADGTYGQLFGWWSEHLQH